MQNGWRSVRLAKNCLKLSKFVKMSKENDRRLRIVKNVKSR